MTELKINLDGQDVPFTTGETIYQVSERHRKNVPTLCNDERLEALGACRLCVVELEGVRNPIASCTTKATAGMVVRTNTETIEGYRKTITEMVVSENGADVKVDPLRGLASQELSQLAERYEVSGDRFLGKTSGTSNTDDKNPFILRDYDKCISCYRCVRVCAEREGDYAISVMNRGFGTQITTEFGKDLRDSECTFCGQCVQTCPTGALADKKAIRHADLPGEIETTRTTCPYCGVGCSVDIMTKGDKMIGILPAMDGPANIGALCVKGQFAYDWVQHGDRLTHPLVRASNGEFVQATWDEALDRAAQNIKKATDEHGRHALYAVASGRAPHESTYALQKLIRAGFGSHYVDNCARS